MNKTLNVFVVDRNGTPIRGARVIVSDAGEVIGSGTTTGMRNRPVGLQLDQTYDSVKVAVEYEGRRKGPVCVDLTNRNYEVVFEEVSVPQTSSGPSTWEKIAVFVFGLIFVVVLLVMAIAVPNPTEFQLLVFRIVLALAAAGVAAIIPGFLNIESRTALYAVRAGGAMGVFLLVYLVNPPALIHTEQRVTIPGDAAWLVGGRLRLDPATGEHSQNGNRFVWAAGPNFAIVNTSDHASREIPKAGDQVRLLNKRPLYIVDYKISGITKTNIEPRRKGTLDSSDETGVQLPAGTILEVRKVDEGMYPGEDESFLWLRVGYPPQ
jgi:hypothetical protein